MVLPRRHFKTPLAVYSEFLALCPPPHHPSLPTHVSPSLFFPLSLLWHESDRNTHNGMLLLRNHLSRFHRVYTATQSSSFLKKIPLRWWEPIKRVCERAQSNISQIMKTPWTQPDCGGKVWDGADGRGWPHHRFGMCETRATPGIFHLGIHTTAPYPNRKPVHSWLFGRGALRRHSPFCRVLFFNRGPDKSHPAQRTATK